MNYIGVDIGGTAVKIGIISETGDVLASSRYSVAFDQYETPILETVLKSLDLFLEDKKTPYAGIGVSATGMIDTRQGIVAGTAGHIKNWNGSKLKESMEQKYHLPVTVLNDANCAALAEKWVGAAKGASDVVVVTIGTGIGGGVIINSKILTGSCGFAGELGHFSICSDGIQCSCKNTGCYEQYASTTALIRMVKDSIHNGMLDINIFPDHKIDGESIFNLLNGTNPVLQSVVDQWLDYITTGLVSLVHIFNPQLILIGGGVCAQDKLLIQPLRTRVLERVMPAFLGNLDLKAASLGNDAGMVGAVHYCMSRTMGENK